MEETYGHVLRSPEDCSCGGVTARKNIVILFSSDSTDEEIEKYLTKHPRIVKEDVLRVAKNGDYVYAEVVFKKPKSQYTYVIGGNYIKGDSSFNALTGIKYPISVHDRAETWGVHNKLSI